MVVPICGVRLYTDMLWYGPVVIGHRGKGDSKPTQHALAQLQSLTSDRTALATGWWLPRSLLYMRTVLGRALIAGTLQAASTSAIMSDRSSWLRLPPLMPPAAASMRCPNFGPLRTRRSAYLQVLLPLRTHRFFRGFGVREVLSQSGRRGGF